MFDNFEKIKFSLTRYNHIVEFSQLLTRSTGTTLNEMMSQSGVQRDLNSIAPEKRLLCVDTPDEDIASYWEVVRTDNRYTQLVIALSVIYSHYDLINVFHSGEHFAPLYGEISSSDEFTGKSFTNVRNAFQRHYHVAFQSGEDKEVIIWNLKELLNYSSFPTVFLDLLRLKFRYVNLVPSGDNQQFIEEVIQERLHEVVGFNDDQFRGLFKKRVKEGNEMFRTFSETNKPLEKAHQRIVYGAPGTGKSFMLDEELESNKENIVSAERVTFYPDYSYFDFIGSYKPVPVYEEQEGALTKSDGSQHIHGRPLINYEFQPGPLLKLLTEAHLNPDCNFVLIVEEINRGSPAAIFGDFFQLLDRDSTGRSTYEISPSPEIQAFYKLNSIDIDKLFLPSNFYLWSTMNNADQGVTPLDTAFKRRWTFEYTDVFSSSVNDNYELKYGGSKVTWKKFRDTINNKLIDLRVNEDKLIGPYFLNARELTEPSSIAYKLFLYLWDDVLRHRQDKLFKEKSFSRVFKEWNDGDGSPLDIEV